MYVVLTPGQYPRTVNCWSVSFNSTWPPRMAGIRNPAGQLIVVEIVDYHVGRHQCRPHHIKAGHGTGARASDVGNDHAIVTRVPRLHVGQDQGGIGAVREIGKTIARVFLPLVSERLDARLPRPGRLRSCRERWPGLRAGWL